MTTVWLGSPHGETWRDRAACADRRVDPDLWHEVDVDIRGQAAHICRAHCRSLAECRAWGDGQPPRKRPSQVIGGIPYDADGQICTRRTSGWIACPWCRPAAGAGAA